MLGGFNIFTRANPTPAVLTKCSLPGNTIEQQKKLIAPSRLPDKNIDDEIAVAAYIQHANGCFASSYTDLEDQYTNDTLAIDFVKRAVALLDDRSQVRALSPYELDVISKVAEHLKSIDHPEAKYVFGLIQIKRSLSNDDLYNPAAAEITFIQAGKYHPGANLQLGMLLHFEPSYFETAICWADNAMHQTDEHKEIALQSHVELAKLYAKQKQHGSRDLAIRHLAKAEKLIEDVHSAKLYLLVAQACSLLGFEEKSVEYTNKGNGIAQPKQPTYSTTTY
jgi:tetratricopeptide (TPR) repeat protein